MGRQISNIEFYPRDDVIIRGKCFVCSVASRKVVLENGGGRHELYLWVTLDEALEKTMPSWMREAIIKMMSFEDTSIHPAVH